MTAAATFSFSAVLLLKQDKVVHFAKDPAVALNLSEALTTTITDEKTLTENADAMRTKMECYITNLQGRIIKKFQELEPNSKFIVDKWQRKEVL